MNLTIIYETKNIYPFSNDTQHLIWTFCSILLKIFKYNSKTIKQNKKWNKKGILEIAFFKSGIELKQNNAIMDFYANF